MRKYKGLRARRLLQYALMHRHRGYDLYPWQVDAIEMLHDKVTVLEFKAGIGKAGLNGRQLQSYEDQVRHINRYGC